MNVLENIHGHEDLLRLNEEERQLLCQEIREFLIDRVSKTGGHLASNLGMVELSVALETVYDTSKDRLVFDVGHQSYVHKMLTGRQQEFDRLRQFGGMAGFPELMGKLYKFLGLTIGVTLSGQSADLKQKAYACSG